MPLSYRIEGTVIYTEAKGAVSIEDLIALKERLYDDPDFRADMVELSDARDVEDLRFMMTDLMSVGQHDQSHSEKLGPAYRLAILVSDRTVFDMARGYEALSVHTGPDVRVFMDMDAARAWLGIGPLAG